MNLFFGKISKEFDQNQIKEGYYQAPKGSTWFGELNIGDYVYLVGGDRIQFWQALAWEVHEGADRLRFTILNPDISISLNDLIALKFLRLSKALFVLTSRSSPKAFHRLELLRDLSPEQLANSTFYQDENIYRCINVVQQKEIDPVSDNIQLYIADGKLQLAPASFYAPDVYSSFRDNLQHRGKGARNKDKALQLVSDHITGKVFSRHELRFRNFYDAFFCTYTGRKYFLVGAFWKGNDPEDMTPLFVSENRWENGYDDQFIKETNAITKGSYIAIKSAYTRERSRSVMMIKARGIVMGNNKDGHHLQVEWENDFKPFEVDFGGYMTTVKEVVTDEHIDAIWIENSDLEPFQENNMNEHFIKLLQYKKQIILQGPPGTGKTRLAQKIAKELIGKSQSTEKSINKENGQCKIIQFHPSYSYEDFVRGIVAKSNPDGEGIIYEAENKVLAQFAKEALDNFKNSQLKTATDIPDEEQAKSNLDSFITHIIEAIDKNGKYPISSNVYIFYVDNKRFKYKGDNWEAHPNGLNMNFSELEKIIAANISQRADIVKLSSLNALTRSHATYYANVLEKYHNFLSSNTAPAATVSLPLKNYVLIIDEINRANLSSVLGELIYALEYRGEEVDSMYAVNENNKLVLPPNLYIIGTMNTADRSVGHIDYAIRRRFAFVDVDSTLLQEDAEIYFNTEGYTKVARLFEQNVSSEFEAKDVQIGHSYFIVKKEEVTVEEKGEIFDLKMNYEVVPILKEYVKDGVLVGSIDGMDIREYIEKL